MISHFKGRNEGKGVIDLFAFISRPKPLEDEVRGMGWGAVEAGGGGGKKHRLGLRGGTQM